MAEQIMSEVITKAVAEATMAEMQIQRITSASAPKLGGPALKQPNFN